MTKAHIPPARAPLSADQLHRRPAAAVDEFPGARSIPPTELSIGDTVYAMAAGLIPVPADDDNHEPADRWTWIAELYASTSWGLVAAIPTFSVHGADLVATACRDIAAGRGTTAQWRSIDDLAHHELDCAATRAVCMAWMAVIDTTTDAFDHLAGRRFSGAEAVTGAFQAILAAHPAPLAGVYIAGALCAWKRIRAVSDADPSGEGTHAVGISLRNSGLASRGTSNRKLSMSNSLCQRLTRSADMSSAVGIATE